MLWGQWEKSEMFLDQGFCCSLRQAPRRGTLPEAPRHQLLFGMLPVSSGRVLRGNSPIARVFSEQMWRQSGG